MSLVSCVGVRGVCSHRADLGLIAPLWCEDGPDILSFVYTQHRNAHTHGRRLGSQPQWGKMRLLFDGTDPGCIERRDTTRMPWVFPGACEFDGRLSLVEHRNELLLYVRANIASRGRRFVQVLPPSCVGLADGWLASTAVLLSLGHNLCTIHTSLHLSRDGENTKGILCWNAPCGTQVTRSQNTESWRPFELISIQDYEPAEGDLYFFSVQQNPVVA